jgi:hypothetical protein
MLMKILLSLRNKWCAAFGGVSGYVAAVKAATLNSNASHPQPCLFLLDKGAIRHMMNTHNNFTNFTKLRTTAEVIDGPQTLATGYSNILLDLPQPDSTGVSV